MSDGFGMSYCSRYFLRSHIACSSRFVTNLLTKYVRSLPWVGFIRGYKFVARLFQGVGDFHSRFEVSELQGILCA